jgi:hypothetical protein
MPDTWSRYRRAVEEEFDLRPEIRLSDVELESERASEQEASSQHETFEQLFDPVRYSKVPEVFLRQKQDTEYLIVFNYLYGEDYRMHLDLNEGDVHVTLFEGYQLAGRTQTTITIIDRGVIDFEIHNSISDERMTFRMRSKSNWIEVNGDSRGATTIKEIYQA